MSARTRRSVFPVSERDNAAAHHQAFVIAGVEARVGEHDRLCRWLRSSPASTRRSSLQRSYQEVLAMPLENCRIDVRRR
eukprot:14666658-Heterocapsa_arctica.AAC.1